MENFEEQITVPSRNSNEFKERFEKLGYEVLVQARGEIPYQCDEKVVDLYLRK